MQAPCVVDSALSAKQCGGQVQPGLTRFGERCFCGFRSPSNVRFNGYFTEAKKIFVWHGPFCRNFVFFCLQMLLLRPSKSTEAKELLETGRFF
jgi:hypothetical protein